MHDSLGDRMKQNYEHRFRFKLVRRMPAIIRLDGKAFHTLTRGCEKPFDAHFHAVMMATAKELCESVQGAKCAYIQSDEISILLTDFDRLGTDAWFDGSIQKIASVSAGIASAEFSIRWLDDLEDQCAVFDSRVFNIPKEEVCNYFIWRQNDWIRNSITMLAQSHYSHKQLHKKGQADMHEMLHEKGVNWAKLHPRWKNGIFLDKTQKLIGWTRHNDVIFKNQRDIIEKWLEPVEE
jgi:tRNA(His) 5'-end guanylyltransferase